MSGFAGSDNVSVLYADLAGFTARSHAADPEDVRALQRPFHVGTRRAVESAGGRVEKFIGDAVVAAFPAPAQAMEGGVAIVGAVRALGEDDLRVRVGIATGLHEEGEVPGVLVEVASRLQALAEHDALCLDAPTYEATTTDGAEELPPMMLPGRSHPAPVYRVRPSSLADAAAAGIGAAEEAAEERKTVTILFCDLFNLGVPMHTADPRDIRSTERPSYGRMKREIESYGGTVEKFVGDALMATFGAPVTREDDPERAVAAALRIVASVDELNAEDEELELGVRVGVNTGEVVVDLSARPDQGENLIVGDAVNTAARLLGVAPFNGVVVGPRTYEETQDAFQYEAMAPVRLKGIPEPVPVFSALKQLRGQVQRRSADPAFVGRGQELALLKGSYARIQLEQELQLVVIGGEPGQGKTRLLAEFRKFVDDQLELALWRQGRSLPFGEGVTFSALADVVKQQAGILESDGGDEAATKLRESVRALTTDRDEVDWLTVRLAPLVGADVPGGDARVDRAEAFAAWRRVLELVARGQPLVLAFEDLHWADEAFLDFLEALADSRAAVPLFVVATTRPDLDDRRPEWARGRDNVTHVPLGPLGPAEGLRLLRSLLPENLVLAEETQAALQDRTGGNPLYTVELVRLLRDRNLLEEDGGEVRLADEAPLALPASVQAVIAARLDALPQGRKAVLQDAAVVGKTFWSGALDALGAECEGGELEELVARELVRPLAVSSIQGDREYSFSHALVRDVAYSQLPREPRVRKHRLTAEWLERVAADRLEDQAEALVHHYGEALELARAARLPEADELARPAGTAFALAGRRASRLDLPKADRYFARALELLPEAGAERAAVLLAAAQAKGLLGAEEEGVRLAAAAAATFEAHRDAVGRAGALLQAARLSRDPELPELCRRVLTELQPEGDSRPLALAYEWLAEDNLYSDPLETVVLADDAIRVASALGLVDEVANAHSVRGRARFYLGENEAGLADLREALRLCLESGLGFETVNAYGWLSVHTWLQEGPRAGLELDDLAYEYARKRGVPADRVTVGARPRILFDLGGWDELIAGAASRSKRDLAFWKTAAAQALARRGDVEQARALAADAREVLVAIDSGRAGIYAPALVASALAEHALGDTAAAVALVEEAVRETEVAPFWRAWLCADASRILVAAGEVELAQRFVDTSDPCDNRRRHCVLTGRAVTAEGAGETSEAAQLYEQAADRWRDWGHPLELGLALLGAARCRTSRDGTAEAALEEARAAFASLRAAPLLDQVAELEARVAR